MTTTQTTRFTGVITALVTPFKNGRVDFTSLRRLVQHQIENGVSGFVVNGTTGESPNLTDSEVEKLFRFVKKLAKGRVDVILGTGSNSTSAAILKTKKAAVWKADAALVVTPYYNKPPQRGLVAHFQAVAKASPKTKIILYNVPGRTVVSLTAETIVELSKIKNIVGVKEASGQVGLVPALRAQTKEGFLLTSGDDASCIDFVLAGGDGVISVVSHVIPAAMSALIDRARKGDESARDEFAKYRNLIDLMGVEANPIPVKMALYLQGLIDSPELRLPLVPLAPEYRVQVAEELKKFSRLSRSK